MLEVKNPPPNAGDLRDVGSIPAGRYGNPLVFLSENPMDREALPATVHRITESDTAEAT